MGRVQPTPQGLAISGVGATTGGNLISATFTGTADTALGPVDPIPPWVLGVLQTLIVLQACAGKILLYLTSSEE